MSAESSEIVSIPRAELDELKADVKRLRLEVGRCVAMARIEADPDPGDNAPTFTRGELAETWGIGEPIQLMVRLSGDESVYAMSPQAPGLAYGRSSLQELRSDLQDVLAFHFDRPGPFDVVEHHERHYEIAGRELVIRIAQDEHRDQRQAVDDRIGRALNVPGQAEALVSTVTNKVGEAIYVCAVPSDTLGWLSAQLDGPGDALVAALTTADQFLLTLPS